MILEWLMPSSDSMQHLSRKYPLLLTWVGSVLDRLLFRAFRGCARSWRKLLCSRTTSSPRACFLLWPWLLGYKLLPSLNLFRIGKWYYDITGKTVSVCDSHFFIRCRQPLTRCDEPLFQSDTPGVRIKNDFIWIAYTSCPGISLSTYDPAYQSKCRC